MTLRRPAPHEAHEYFHRYINKVPGDDFLQSLKDSTTSILAMLENLAEAKWDYRYAEGKWSVKEALVHMMDTERIFSYRALRVARNDQTPMPGFEQDDYVPFYEVDHRSPASLIAEYKAIRQATLEMFENFSDEMLGRVGTASGHPISARALGFMTAGHELHHLEIFKERYQIG